MSPPRRVLVTGGTGCVGRSLLPLLVTRGWDVHATTSRDTAPTVDGVTWHHANLLRPTEAARVVEAVSPEALMHLAWFVSPGQWATAGANLDWVDATLRLIRAFAESGGKRQVVAGSCLEYDWDYGFCSEARTPCAPHTLYGTAKHASRLLLESFATQTKVSVCWGRIFCLYGPHEHPSRLIASVVQALLKGERARCSHGQQVRDYLFVADVADAFVRLLESDVRGTINVASGRPITLRSLVTRVGELIGRPELIEFGAIRAASSDKPFVVGDVTRLSSELAWGPSYSLDDGLNATIQWWREQQSRPVTTS